MSELRRSSSFGKLEIDFETSLRDGPGLHDSKNKLNPTPSCDASGEDTDDGPHVSFDESEKGRRTSAMLRPAIVKDETIAVEKMRIVIFTVLCISTVGVVLAIIFYSRQLEYSQFESQFESDAQKIADEAGNKLNLMLGTMDSFLAATATLTKVTNSSWPYVTTENFADRASRMLRRTRTVSLSQFNLVLDDHRPLWEGYSLENDEWVDQGIEYLKSDSSFSGSIIEDYSKSVHIFDAEGKSETSWAYLPKWQHAPVVPIDPPYNYNGFASPTLEGSWSSLQEGQAIVSHVLNMAEPSSSSAYGARAERNKEWIKAIVGGKRASDDPLSELYYPIFEEPWGGLSSPVGVLSLAFFWGDMLKNVLTTEDQVLYAVFNNQCGQVFTMEICGPNVNYLGVGDMHDTKYTYIEESFLLKNTSADAVEELVGFPLADGACPYTVSLYPYASYQRSFHSASPVIFSVGAFFILALAAVLFWLYDSLVEFRQGALLSEAARTEAIVSSLFPENVRDRIWDKDVAMYEPPKTRLKSFLQHNNSTKTMEGDSEEEESRQIADLFPETTVLFADIAGFTAWSSVREPSHVFTLLEAIYGAFDVIAAKRGVFKVETIGDAYVAVTGLPEPRKDHAVVMVKFARDCRSKCIDITRELEVSLGPGTGDLRYRFGLHSGPVTAGVLRGQKSRFQLFGDTVNTAARMESTGRAHQIHVSEATASLLKEAGKESWVRQRKEKIEAKGKGLMQTYWVELQSTVEEAGLAEDASMTFSLVDMDVNAEFEDKIVRLINWNTDVLSRLICRILERRELSSSPGLERSSSFVWHEGTIAIDEVKEIVQLPEFDKAASSKEGNGRVTELPEHIMWQLKEFVARIAQRYMDNPFHNFEHASHVAMSAAKLLSRIVEPDKVYVDGVAFDKGTMAWSMHDHTFGIASDPLTHFACVFAAIIHDVGHRGVPNPQLMKEDEDLAEKYRGKSVAEQNSVDIAWSIFMDDRFKELRRTICHTHEDLRHFRELVVNSVIATDVFDPDLKKLRNDRWEKAFNADKQIDEPDRDRVNRKATIVIEHLIQASDVAHTMQHWHVYRNWNEHLFEEMYYAYLGGRAEKDPSTFWYEGEMKFFDFYVIPLAKKLSDCGVFGVSSDEYLTYAVKNREEWERRGKEVVEAIHQKVSRVTGSRSTDSLTSRTSHEDFGLPMETFDIKC